MEASEEKGKSRKGKIIITSTPLSNHWAHQMFMESGKQGIKAPTHVVWDEAREINPEVFYKLRQDMEGISAFKCDIDLTDLLTVGDNYYISKDNIARKNKYVGKNRVSGEYMFSSEQPMMDGTYTLDLGGVKHTMIKENQEYYYLHNGQYVGNAMLWWRKGGSGYTTNIREAHKYTREEALALHKSRNTDIPWRSDHVDERAIMIADNQYMDTVNILKL